MRNICIGLLALGLACVSGPSAWAEDTIVGYTFTGSTLNPTTEAPNSDAGAFTFGSDFSNASIPNTGNPAPGIAVPVNQIPSSIGTNAYVGFTVEADPGYTLNLASLIFDYAFTRSSGGTFSASWYVRSSLDGFTSNLATYGQDVTTSVVWTTTNPAVDLSAPAFSNLPSVGFRIYLTETGATTAFMRMDNVLLNGTVTAVPEPATWGLGLLLLGGTVLWEMKRRSFRP